MKTNSEYIKIIDLDNKSIEEIEEYMRQGYEIHSEDGHTEGRLPYEKKPV